MASAVPASFDQLPPADTEKQRVDDSIWGHSEGGQVSWAVYLPVNIRESCQSVCSCPGWDWIKVLFILGKHIQETQFSIANHDFLLMSLVVSVFHKLRRYHIAKLNTLKLQSGNTWKSCARQFFSKRFSSRPILFEKKKCILLVFCGILIKILGKKCRIWISNYKKYNAHIAILFQSP